MNSVINFVELENRVISATYRNLMVRAKVVLVDKASGEQLPDPSPRLPHRRPTARCGSGCRRPSSRGILPDSAERAWRGCGAKRRVLRRLTAGLCRFCDSPARPDLRATIANCPACRRWCKAAHRPFVWRRFYRNPFDDAVVCVRADDGCGDFRRALAAGPKPGHAKRRQRGHRLQGSTRRDRPRSCRGADRVAGGRGRAGRNQPPPAVGRGPPARAADGGEHKTAPHRRRS